MNSRRIGVMAACFAALVFCLSPRVEAAWIVDGTVVCGSAGTQDYVHVASDGSGGAFMVWHDGRIASYDIYIQHIDAEGNSLWTTNGVALCTVTGDQEVPRVVPDGSGGAIAVWMDERAGTSDANIYAQRVDASGVVQWAAGGVVVCSAGGLQNLPRIESDGSGGAIIAWQDGRSGSNWDIYVQRMSAAGAALWTVNGVAVCTAASHQQSPEMIPDGSGGAIIAWQDERTGTPDIYAQRVDGSGAVQWTADGVALCTAVNTQYFPRLCTDGAGGAIVAWHDARAGISWDIYANRVSSAGIVQWGANGTLLCSAANAQVLPCAASDGAGGAIVAWQDSRSGGYDIYAQRVNSTGAMLWGAQGVAVCVASGDQTSPMAIADGANGAIIAWPDHRSGAYDVYAQHIASTGAALWSSNGAAISAASGNQQNPAIAGGEPGGAIIAWQDDRSGNIDIYASATPLCGISPTALDFGALYDDFADLDFVIRNTGGATVTGTVADTCSYFSLIAGGGAFSIAPDDSLVVTVRFEPAEAGTFDCTIETGTECGGVSCTGIGVAPVCSMYPAALDFGSIPMGSYADRSFSMTNEGGLRLTGSVTEACADYSVVAGSGPYDLGGGDSLIVTVRFAPGATGASACTLSTGGICGDVACSASAHREPCIHLVRDVPGDQGGVVSVAWRSSPGDDPATHAITRYTVWRAIDMTAAKLAGLAPGSILERVSDLPPAAAKDAVRAEYLGSTMFYWELMSSVDAYYLEAYSKAVPTLFDSTAACQEYHYFQIIAHTSDPYTFWISDPDSGRSVDNLSPAPPVGLAGEQRYAPAGLLITWAPNDEADLEGYAVYRGTSAAFVPGPGNFVASTPDTLLLDGEWQWDGGYYYKVAAIDIHGNESGYALLAPDAITGEETPKTPEATYLSQNFPNPFNPVTKIEFGLAAPASVRVRIYDAAGRLVRTLVDGARPAGRYSELWDGLDSRGGAVASGIYFYRLDAGAFTQTKKMVLLR